MGELVGVKVGVGECVGVGVTVSVGVGLGEPPTLNDGVGVGVLVPWNPITNTFQLFKSWSGDKIVGSTLLVDK